jgi:iron complex outermembrane receptor protein
MKTPKFPSGYAIAMATFVCTGTAMAQEATAPEGVTELQSITVTAQKQEQSVLDVPNSITVLGGQDIEDRNIQSVLDLADAIPNFTVFNEGTRTISTPSMRGLHADLQIQTVSTGLYIDGVPVTVPAGYDNQMLSIERVEVLRGPQGTLYGKGAQNGAINIITKQPGNDFEGKIAAQGGRWLSGDTDDEFIGKLNMNLSGPIVEDKLFYSVIGQYSQRDGFIQNTTTGRAANDREDWLGRVNLLWTPTEDLDVSFVASHTEFDDGDVSANVASATDRTVSSNFQGFNKLTDQAQSMKIGYAINEKLTLTSVTTNSKFEFDNRQDWDFTAAPLFDLRPRREYKTTSQEVRLDYSSEGLKWLVGLYYDKNSIDLDLDRVVFGTPSSLFQYQEGNTFALFTNVTYPLTERLSLVGGLRYEKEEQDFEGSTLPSKLDESWDAVTPKVALNYRVRPNVTTYISAAKGYRPGGINWFAPGTDTRFFDPEELWSYEIGLKSFWLNGNLTLNAALYYIDISDMQVTEAITPVTTVTANAAEATSKGIELEMTAWLSDRWSVMLGYGYNDITFDEFSDALGDYKGNTAPYAPEYTYNVGAQYKHPRGFYGRVDLIGRGKMYNDKANMFPMDGYELVNLKMGYEAEAFDVYLYGKNVFDKEYNNDGYFGGAYTLYSDPGELGLQVNYRF